MGMYAEIHTSAVRKVDVRPRSASARPGKVGALV